MSQGFKVYPKNLVKASMKQRPTSWNIQIYPSNNLAMYPKTTSSHLKFAFTIMQYI